MAGLAITETTKPRKRKQQASLLDERVEDPTDADLVDMKTNEGINVYPTYNRFKLIIYITNNISID